MATSQVNSDPREVDRPSGSSSGNCGGGGGCGGSGMRLKKGPWTPEEDAILIEYLKKHGLGRWNSVQKHSGLARCAKSCRLRWTNHLNPNIKKGSFTPEEEMIIVKYHAKYGNKWARMATKLPGRTDNEIKNYWHTRMKRRLKQGLSLYPESTEGELTPEHDLDNLINNDDHQNSNTKNNNGNFSPNPDPLSLTTPTQSPRQQNLISSYHLSSPHNLSPSPRNLSLAQPFSPTYQSTLSLIDPSAISFTNSRNPPILSSPLGRFKRFQNTNGLSSLQLQSTQLPSSLLSHSSPITSLPLSPSLSSIGTSLSPILRTQYKAGGITSSGFSFNLNSELPSSPLSQTAFFKSPNMHLSSSQLSPRTALKSTSTRNLQLPLSQLWPKSPIDAQVNLCRAKGEAENRLLDALISPRGVTKRKHWSSDESNSLQEHQEKEYGMNVRHGSLENLSVTEGLSRNFSSTNESSREALVRKSLKTEDLLGNRLARDGLMASQEQNCLIDGFDLVSRQSTNSSQLGSTSGWSEMSSLHSSAEERAKEGPQEEQINSMTEELSSLLEYFPTIVQVPEWHTNDQEILKEPTQREVQVNLEQKNPWNNFSRFC